ncbi:MAG: hypothetical protein AB2L14_30255 [Candidatus Xenobiia bacterium LiM19]
MQTLKDRTTGSSRFFVRTGQIKESSMEKNVQRQAIITHPSMMAGAYELQNALASICRESCRRREKCRDMLHLCWDSFIM